MNRLLLAFLLGLGVAACGIAKAHKALQPQIKALNAYINGQSPEETK